MIKYTILSLLQLTSVKASAKEGRREKFQNCLIWRRIFVGFRACSRAVVTSIFGLGFALMSFTHLKVAGTLAGSYSSDKTRMLFYYWQSGTDAGPPLKQHLNNGSRTSVIFRLNLNAIQYVSFYFHTEHNAWIQLCADVGTRLSSSC